MKTTFQALLGITTLAFAGQAAAQATPDSQRNQFETAHPQRN